MNPHLTQALAAQKIADLRRAAAAGTLATAASASYAPVTSGTLGQRASRLIRSLGGRRYRQIELVWPDGVCTVVPAQSDDPHRPLANSRR
ncbi:MAG: hypothetical protein WBH47_26725 [Streptosporangiaceae bacterium]